MSAPVDLHRVRTALFVPVLEPRFFARAGDRGAQALILDLEDAIAPARKDEARGALAGAVFALRPCGLPLLVRVNTDAGWIDADLQAAVAAGADALVLPKMESAEQVRQACARMDRHARDAGVAAPGAVAVLVETPRGVLQADSIASADIRVQAIGFGAEDYATAMGRPPHHDLLLPAAARVAMCAAAAGVACWGLAGSIAELTDLQALEQLAQLSRRIGFSGSPAVHPAQVDVFNRAFAPTAQELDEARRIVAAHEASEAAGVGAHRLDGRMIDRPLVERARRLLG